jgi:hypothetical protein
VVAAAAGGRVIAQSELTPLEHGRHALLATTKYGANGGISVAAYAAKVKGLENGTEAEKKAAKQEVLQQIWAWEVYDQCKHVLASNPPLRHLVVIHAAPPEYWEELAQRMVDERWTVEQTEAAVKVQSD